jgi:hypothetical protein
MGETRFRNFVAAELEKAGAPDVDKNNGKLPVDLKGT